VCQIKLEKDPMKFFVEKEIEKLAKIPFAEIDSSKAGKDDLDTRLKWLGLFHRRKHQCSSLSLSLSLSLPPMHLVTLHKPLLSLTVKPATL
jgi:ferredoxin-nitrite reductase